MPIPANVYLDTYEAAIRTGDDTHVDTALKIIKCESPEVFSYIMVRRELQDIVDLRERVMSGDTSERDGGDTDDSA